MLDLIDLQRGLYASAVEALKAAPGVGWSGLPALVGAAFGFGMMHALLPGHGKAVLASHYAGEGRVLGALGASIILIVTHVGSAILLVLGGIALLQKTIGGAGRAPVLETASQSLIVAVGLWMLWRAFKPHSRNHERSGSTLALVTGIVPCPLTTFIMSYAVVNGLVAAGLVLSGAFAAGMVVTVAVFPLLAVLLRTRFLPLMARTETWRRRIGHLLEVIAALLVIFLGFWPLLPRWL